ncbi:flagellar filament capping protein FliD [Dethiosulfovibrio salsuginis]|uniref:Flagellar hook-associated protein 2 n=1 Tax=Dethiosulfovibrio salsuginis TaxID=561720 RepID=A0A1X7JJ23_9BACT|nr:flagellar filament capping protein FliD [Dethiosulfovibrio salsuginis]SMG27294.1 flagellar hook-associated protein 2 [Dethiosulfovibrio salsuginis]
MAIDSSSPLFQMTGLSSGMDWGAMIDKQMAQSRKVQTKWEDQIQTLEDKIYLYNEFSSNLKTLRSSLTSMKLQSTYTAKQAEYSVLAAPAGSSVLPQPQSILTADVTPDADIGRWDIEVTNVGVAERRMSNRQDSSTEKLSALGYSGSGSFSIRSGVHAAIVEYDTATDSLNDIAQKINDTGVGVAAKVIDNRLVMESVDTGFNVQTTTDTITRQKATDPGYDPAYDDLAGINITDASSITTIKDSKNITYTAGTDFEVVQGSNGWQIHWLASGTRPADSTDTEDITYDVEYSYEANPFQVYGLDDKVDLVKREDEGGTTADYDVLSASAASASGTIQTIVGQDNTTYYLGTDFEIANDPLTGDPSIHWLSGGDAKRPTSGTTYSVQYRDTAQNNILREIGFFNETSSQHVKPEDTTLTLNGIEVTRSTNEIDDLIDGVTLDIIGEGKIRVDVTQDAENAVTAIQEFVTAYNNAIDWINIKSEEKPFNYSDTNKNRDLTEATPTTDIERRRGLLRGDSNLRQTKGTLRGLSSNPMPLIYNTTTGSRASGTMAERGLTDASGDYNLYITIDGIRGEIPITSTDTIQDVSAKINAYEPFLKDSTGKAYSPPLIIASSSDSKLSLKAPTGKTFQIGGDSEVLSATGLKNDFSLLSEIGLSTEALDFGKSGKLEFDTEKFMEAIQENSEDLGNIMVSFANRMDSEINDMVSSIQTEVGGTVAIKGGLPSQQKAWQSQIDALNKRITDHERRLTMRQQSLYQQYARMEQYMSNMSSQSSWLASVSGNLSAMSEE